MVKIIIYALDSGHWPVRGGQSAKKLVSVLQTANVLAGQYERRR